MMIERRNEQTLTVCNGVRQVHVEEAREYSFQTWLDVHRFDEGKALDGISLSLSRDEVLRLIDALEATL